MKILALINGKNTGRVSGAVFVLFICLGILITQARPAHAQCGFNAIGDYTCGGGNTNPSGTPTTGASGNNTVFNETIIPILQQAPLCGTALTAQLSSLPSVIVDALSPQIASALTRAQATGNGEIVCDIVDDVNGIDLSCTPGGGGGAGGNDDVSANFIDAFMSSFYNTVAQQLAWNINLGAGAPPVNTQQACDSVPPPSPPATPSATPSGEWCEEAQANGGGSQQSPIGSAEQIEGGGSCGERIANSAINSIGASTADIPGTENGNVGCAAAVTNILQCADQDVQFTLSTGVLYDNLSNDPCFEQVCTGNISNCDLQPGDVLVTARGSRAGHTGIYVGSNAGVQNEIVSNSSSGFQGSARGTVQPNYSVSAWDSGVTSRNPSRSGAFRCRC